MKDPGRAGIFAAAMAERFDLDLTGIRCPLNWARAKVRLETLSPGDVVSLVVDDERSVRDLPRAAEAEGYAVLEVRAEPGRWRIVIER